MRESAKLRRVMQTILSLGNALNSGTARGRILNTGGVGDSIHSIVSVLCFVIPFMYIDVYHIGILCLRFCHMCRISNWIQAGQSPQAHGHTGTQQ